MLTVRFERLAIKRGDNFLDAGTGFGRHAFEAARHGAAVVVLDFAQKEVVYTTATFAAMYESNEIGSETFSGAIRGDATTLPFADNSFDWVVTSEVLEHIANDTAAITELVRVLRPGGVLVATVPSWFPERLNWALSEKYHAPYVVGGHVRIYRYREFCQQLKKSGLLKIGAHKSHGLHSPYWWLRCAVGPQRDDVKAVSLYRRFLEWEITRRPFLLRVLERVISPLIGKSLVIYARKPVKGLEHG